MGSKTTAFANSILDLSTGRTALALPTTFLALCTADPGSAGGAIAHEVATVGYARVPCSTGVSSIFSAASSGATSNPGTLTFGSAVAVDVTVTFAAIIDSGGLVLQRAQLGTPLVCPAGQTITAATGAITFTET